jgi:hypothetical protein
MNVTRLLLGGLAAGVICFIGDGLIHGLILKEQWAETMTGLGKTVQEDPTDFAFFAVYDLLKGFFGVWLYAAIRGKFGPGPKTGLIAGAATWVGTTLIPHITWLAIPIFAQAFVAQWMVFEAVPIFLGVFAGAAIYKEATA